MRFIIHGAGSIGSLIGGRLAESGVDAILIARDDHAATIKREGLRIKDRAGDRVVKNLKAVTHPREISPRPGDVIMLTVKSSQTSSSVQSLREIFSEDTPVVCMQNGVRNEEIAASRFLRVYGGMLGISATYLKPGAIAYTRGELISISNYPLSCDETGFQIAERLKMAGFKATTHESIMAVKWSKLILNLNNATLAIIDKHLQLGMVIPAISHFMAEVQEEGLRVLEAAGISIHDSNNPIELSKGLAELRNMIEDPEKIRAAADLPPELRTYPSTWMDLRLKRGETEAGYFNGEIILLGEKYRIPTPYNSTLFQVVETMAANRAQPGLCDIEELAKLVERRSQQLQDQNL